MKKLIGSALMLATLSSLASPLSENLGQGILSFNPKAGLKDVCINVLDENVSLDNVGTTSYSLQLVKTKEEFEQKIKLSAGGKAGFGVFNGSSKSKFVEETRWDFNSTYVLVKATRISYKKSISKGNILLTDYSQKILRNSKFVFNESCGDEFAQGIELGGEIYGLMEIKAESYEHKKQIESSLDASGSLGAVTFSASGSFSETIRKFKSKYQVSLRFERTGMTNINVPQTAEGLIELAGQIEKNSDDHPVAINYITRKYETLSNYLSTDDGIEEQIRENIIQNASKKLEDARNSYAKILYVLENPRQFKSFNEKVLKAKLAYFDDAILKMKNFVAKSHSFLNDVSMKEIQFDLDDSFLPEATIWSRQKIENIPSEMKRSAICGVESYQEKESYACGVIAPKVGTGPVCGAIYKEASSLNCGITMFKLGSGVACGPLRYNQCHSSDCGKKWDGSRKRCRTSACGVEVYKTCRDQSFGPELFNTCRNEAHGVESYNTCSDVSFGYDFNKCAHFSHGPKEYKLCRVAKIGNQETYYPQF
jgi:hypothetical protein